MVARTSLAFALLALVGGASAFTAHATSRPLVVRPVGSSFRVAESPRAATPLLPTGLYGATVTLANVIPGGVGYGGKSAFWDSASSSAGSDINVIVFLTVVFPIAVTAFFFIDRD